MVLRLSELLERIRPAGTPGAPTEGEKQRDQLAQHREISDIAAALAAFDTEADALIAAASAEAAEIDRDAERKAREIRAAVPDRIAAIQAATARGHEKQDDAEQTQVVDQTGSEVARLTSQAAALTPRLVAAVTEAVWAIAELETPPEDRR